jgi:hypothetical protein
MEKSLTRQFLSDLFPSDCAETKVSVITTKIYYFIAHLSQADLCMLNDFYNITENLSIVNGSFVNLRDPIKYCDKKIHLRDSMLLAPAGRRSLAQIGKLYGDAFNKNQYLSKRLK